MKPESVNKPVVITIPKGTEINNGPSEDSDSIVLGKDFEAIIVGKEKDGGIPVKLIGLEGEGEIDAQVRIFHQPPGDRAE